MQRAKLRRYLATGALAGALLLGACAETTLTVHTIKQVTDPGQKRQQGIYKVGDPYQVNGVWYYPSEDYGYNETGIASYYGGERSGTNFHGRQTANGEVYDQNALTAAHQTLPLPSLVRVTNLENGRSLVLRVNDRGPFTRGRVIDVSRRAAQLLGFEAQGTARVRVTILPDESRQLKLALLQGDTEAGGATVVAAAPRESVASDALPPPPGARASGAVASGALPPPSATLPSAQPSTAGRGGARSEGIARPAPPVAPGGSTTPVGSRGGSSEVAALPVPEQAAAVPVLTVVPVRSTSLYVQAGAFASRDNAQRLGARLSSFGRTQVQPIRVGPQELYRVRVGPVQSVREADQLLERVASIAPEARVVVD